MNTTHLKIDDRLYDPEFRRQLREDPGSHLQGLGFDAVQASQIAKNDIVVKTCPSKVLYISIMQVDGNHKLSSGDLNSINAAGIYDESGVGTAGTVGSAGSASSVGTITSTASSGSTASTALTVGSVGSQ